MELITVGTKDYKIYRDNFIKESQLMYIAFNTPGATNVKEFDPLWTTSGSIKDFCSDIIRDPKVKVGDIYLGEIECSGLPDNIRRGDLRVEVVKGLSEKLLLLSITSASSFPNCYYCSYYVWNITPWEKLILDSSSSTTDALYYENIYIGVAEERDDIIIPQCYHDTIMRGIPLRFDNVSGYVYILLPDRYTHPLLFQAGMSLVEIPAIWSESVTIGGQEYKVYKSVNHYSGSFKVYLF
mgnify:CR=1 FL=1